VIFLFNITYHFLYRWHLDVLEIPISGSYVNKTQLLKEFRLMVLSCWNCFLMNSPITLSINATNPTRHNSPLIPGRVNCFVGVMIRRLYNQLACEAAIAIAFTHSKRLYFIEQFEVITVASSSSYESFYDNSAANCRYGASLGGTLCGTSKTCR